MDNNVVQSMVMGVVGLNTVATFSMAYFVGCYKGSLDEWRKTIDVTVKGHSDSITAIHQQDVRQATVDGQIKRQSELIRLLGRRTHDLRNVLTAKNLMGSDMASFDEPVSGD